MYNYRVFFTVIGLSTRRVIHSIELAELDLLIGRGLSFDGLTEPCQHR